MTINWQNYYDRTNNGKLITTFQDNCIYNLNYSEFNHIYNMICKINKLLLCKNIIILIMILLDLMNILENRI